MATSVCVQMQYAMRSAFSRASLSHFSSPKQISAAGMATATSLSSVTLQSSESATSSFETPSSSEDLSSPFVKGVGISSPASSSMSSIDDDLVSDFDEDDLEATLASLDSSLTVAVAEKLRSTMAEKDAGVTPLMDMATWIDHILASAQCARGVVLISLIYCERLFALNPLVKLTLDNWKSITAISILLASKVWDDISMLNKDYTYFLPFSLSQINEWERAFLRGLKYNVQVDSQLYEKYFFELRYVSNCLTHLSTEEKKKKTGSMDLKSRLALASSKRARDRTPPSPNGSVSSVSTTE